jgi:hypothetical protein
VVDDRRPPPRPDRERADRIITTGPARDIAAEADRLARENSQKRIPKLSTPPPERPPERAPERGERGSGDSPKPVAKPLVRPAVAKKTTQDSSHRPGVGDQVALEFEELLRDMGLAWRRWSAAQKVTTVAALTTLLGTMLPWISTPSRPYVLGVAAGGVVHVLLAVASLALTWRAEAAPEGTTGHSVRRRTALLHLLIGALSTAVGAWFVVTYGLERRVAPLTIRFGLYVTLLAGAALSYGGFARFRAPDLASR